MYIKAHLDKHEAFIYSPTIKAVDG